jgi:hypothetical protein
MDLKQKLELSDKTGCGKDCCSVYIDGNGNPTSCSSTKIKDLLMAESIIIRGNPSDKQIKKLQRFNDKITVNPLRSFRI